MDKNKLKQKIEQAKAKELARNEKDRIKVINNKDTKKIEENKKQIAEQIRTEKLAEQKEMSLDRVNALFSRARVKHGKNDKLIEQVKNKGYGGKEGLTQGQASGIAFRMKKQGYEVTTGKGDDGTYFVAIRTKKES